jgi:hypothetical protein
VGSAFQKNIVSDPKLLFPVQISNLKAAQPKQFLERIVVDWKRFFNGIWRHRMGAKSFGFWTTKTIHLSKDRSPEIIDACSQSETAQVRGF